MAPVSSLLDSFEGPMASAAALGVGLPVVLLIMVWSGRCAYGAVGTYEALAQRRIA
jgi:hypothetical protein